MLNFKSVNITASVIFIGLIVCHYFFSLSLWYIVLLMVFWFLITALGSGLIGWNYHLKAILSNTSTKTNHVSITFDDGPNSTFTPQVLELLKKHHAKATFFCIGKHIENHPDIIKNILDQGHTIGNHTYSHANSFGFFSTENVIKELQKTNSIVQNQTGLKLNLYRPAFGVTNPNIARAVKALKLTTIGWNKRSLDTTKLSDEAVLKRITTSLKAGDIILLHDTSEKTLIVLEQLLLFLQQQNLESVTVDSLCKIKPYA